MSTRFIPEWLVYMVYNFETHANIARVNMDDLIKGVCLKIQ